MNTNCYFFIVDRPCSYQKKNIYLKCNSNCVYYRPINTKIIIIKLSALGDVLRTTCILKYLYEKYNNPYIIWITDKQAVPLLKNINYIKEVITNDEIYTLCKILIEEFDILINLDLSLDAISLAGIVKAKKKLGYGMNENGEIICFNQKAKEYLELSHNDVLKKKNKKTYQEHILNIISDGKEKYIEPNKYKILVKLNNEEIEFSEKFKKLHKISDKNIIIGINTSGGTTWQKKSWSIENTVKLIKLLTKKLNCKILLFGGKKEQERNKIIIEKIKNENLIDTGTDNSLREFIALLNLCDIVVTVDTLSLHIALGLNKKVVALFGPTSSNEIEMYNCGVKISSSINCCVCYKRMCDKKLDCMSLITPEKVYKVVKNTFYKILK